MLGENHQLTPGYVARHTPPNSPVGLPIAVLDIAQDFLLAHLHREGLFDDLLAFKGGTALRKLYAGQEGRFSTDLDFSVQGFDVDTDTIAEMVAEACDTELGPFRYAPERERGRWRIHVTSQYPDPPVSIKLDIGPPSWLIPATRAFVEQPVHDRYGFELPGLQCMRLEEMLGEKVARLARTSTARDAWDLVWVATTSPHSQFSRDLVRKLCVLKVWADNNGLEPAWPPAIEPKSFDPEVWLSSREGQWDDEQIGRLAHGTPDLTVLEADLQRLYSWVAELTPEQRRFARADPRDRGDVINAVQGLPRSALEDGQVW